MDQENNKLRSERRSHSGRRSEASNHGAARRGNALVLHCPVMHPRQQRRATHDERGRSNAVGVPSPIPGNPILVFRRLLSKVEEHREREKWLEASKRSFGLRSLEF